ETKSSLEWISDPRCGPIGHRLLKRRISDGVQPELALQKDLVPFGVKVYTAFGETKTVADWAADPRCTISRGNLYNRIELGIPFEEALTAPPGMRAKPMFS